MGNTATRVPAFAQFVDRDKDKELFEGEDTPRGKALDKAISESVERLIADDWDGALNLANMASKCLIMTDDEFAEIGE